MRPQTRQLEGSRAHPVAKVGALMVLRGCLTALPETAAALSTAAVEAGLIRHVLSLLEDDSSVTVEWAVGSRLCSHAGVCQTLRWICLIRPGKYLFAKVYASRVDSFRQFLQANGCAK